MTPRITSRLGFGALLGLATAAGCAVDTTNDEDRTDPPSAEEGRGRTGKADLLGSCSANQCGGKGTGQCWCDEICVQYGDCCSNVQAVCSLGNNTCTADEDCSEGWCGWDTDDVTRICKPFSQIGESCQGFVIPSARNKCHPDLECQFSEPTFDVPGVCQPKTCDPNLFCTQVLTCVDGAMYPTGCGPANCDAPIGPCQAPPPPPPPEPTCENMCGGPAIDKACYCDSACAFYGDCCDDYAQFCP